MALSINGNKNIQSVPLARIDADDELFRMSFCPALGALTDSIKNVGMVNPVILRGEDPYQIVSGFRRVLAAQRLGREEVSAKIFSPPELSIDDGFRLNFFENAGTRRFNLIEASMVVAGFLEKCIRSEKQVREEILPLLGFHPGSKVLRALSSLRLLSNEWKVQVVTKEISLLNAAHLACFSPTDQRCLYAAIAGLKLGENKLRESLEMLNDICQREGIAVDALLSSAPFKSLDDDPNRNLTEKTEKFRKILKSVRYPAYNRMEEKFLEHKKKLSLPASVSLMPPEFFEGNKLRVTFDFRSQDEFQAVLEKLGKAADSEALKGMLEMI